MPDDPIIGFTFLSGDVASPTKHEVTGFAAGNPDYVDITVTYPDGRRLLTGQPTAYIKQRMYEVNV